jgi:hypothetical protein
MLALLGSLLAAMTGLVACAPPLYQIFCAATGCGTRPDERIGNARRQPEAGPRNRLGHPRSSEDDLEKTLLRRHSMGDELAASNVNRSYGLAATSIAIFTFVLFFLYPRFASGEINALLFQFTLVAMGVATFSFVFASFYYYCSSLGSRIDDAERALYSWRADRFWLLGYILLFLAPSLILFAVGLLAVGSVWFALWLVYLLFVIRNFLRVQTPRESSSRGEA